MRLEVKRMYLSSIDINNFRSLKELKVEFRPGLNVLVGRNNTGKTNLMQAIRCALGPSASRGDTVWLEKDDFYKESPSDETERTISIILKFKGLTEAERSYFYDIVDFDLTDINKSKAIIRFEASWPKKKRQASIKRTGGPQVTEPVDIPTKILDSIPITYLPALRDAEASLAPGVRSRLARLLQELAERKNGNDKTEIENIYIEANKKIEKHDLVKKTKDSLQITTKDIAGSDYSASNINAVEANFFRILRTLQVQMVEAPIGSLDANGLGYNNLLYIAVVLEHLKSPDIDELPLLLVEEPEAHLHPQLAILLADYLANNTPGNNIPQTIITTHSPTLAANIPPNKINVMFIDENLHPKCNCISSADMEEKEQNELQRMMDITRATLYFAKAAILVEGISETLLLPIFAKRLGYDLNKLHISVIPICGVAFETFKKLLDPHVLGIPISIVTDADPPIIRGNTWEQDMPQQDDNEYQLSDRTKKIIKIFENHSTVKVFHSKLTLEYDLAEAGNENALVMADIWKTCFVGKPGTFSRNKVIIAGSSNKDKALAAWRGICRAEHTGSKAEFAQRLAAHLSIHDTNKQFIHSFDIPEYLELAIRRVTGNILPAKLNKGEIFDENTDK
jgi:putative ATP-dependent endonuclease of the OLD family